MMDYTDRFCRYFLRLISKRCLLYTEMVTTGALIHGDRDRYLEFDRSEHPVALQLGGSEPGELATCARYAEARGFDELNLNCGCPSDRVQSGKFGACLMRTPAAVGDAVSAMRDAVSIPVTVKNRIGVDGYDSYQHLCDFIGQVADAGCSCFIVHARKAWLNGLSPKQNREIPPLQYGIVYRLKQDFPELEIIINGGVNSLTVAEEHLDRVDGVMIGRAAYHDPFLLAEADQRIFGEPVRQRQRSEILSDFAEFAAGELHRGTRLSHMTRHILGLYNGQPGARRFRRHISTNASAPNAGINVLFDALAAMAPVLEQ